MQKFLGAYPFEFQSKIRRFRRWQDAQLSLLGRVLLFEGIKRFNKKKTPLDIRYTSHNKPYFEDENLRFNISHSSEIVICALSNSCEVGIDIEYLNEIEVADFHPQMSETEWHKVTSANNTVDAFYDYWTSKEAVIKVHGNGLSIPLKSFEINNNKTIIDSQNFYLKELTINEDYKCYLSSDIMLDEVPVKITKMLYP